MTLSKSQLNQIFAASLLLSFAIALTLALLIVQLGSQISHTLDNLVMSSLRPTLALPASTPIALITGHSPADDILNEWKVKHSEATAPRTVNEVTPTKITNHTQMITTQDLEIINFPQLITPHDLDLTDFSLRDLKDLAKLRGISHYSKMTKAQLKAALS